MAIDTLIQMPYQWLYNPMIEINTIGYVIETLQNIIKMFKYLPQLQSASVTIIYKLAEQSTSGLGIFLECQKCNILVITQELMLCLVYMYLPLGAAHLRVSCIYIRQSTFACIITYIHTHKHTHTYM